jgi:lysophospholipase L1-like esterase
MIVFIGGDSRCSHGTATEHVGTVDERTDSWSNRLIWDCPNIKFFTRRSSYELVSYSIYDTGPLFKGFTDGFFDVAFIQTGFNDGIEYWTERIFTNIVGKRFNKKCLINGHPVEGKDDHFNYVDRETERTMFELLKRKCKRVVFIGMHSLEGFKSVIPFKPSQNENVEKTNEVFSRLASDYIKLPTSVEWADEYCQNDRIHFNEKGINYILSEVKKFL